MNSEHLSMIAAFMFQHAGGSGDVRIKNSVDMAIKLLDESKRQCKALNDAEDERRRTEALRQPVIPGEPDYQ